MIPLNQFFQELKIRNVRKTMAIYIGVALTSFGILKVFVETYNLPTTIFPYVVTILTCGSVSAFVFAWFHGKADKQGFHKKEVLIHSFVGVMAIGIALIVGSSVRHAPKSSSESLVAANQNGSKTIAVLPFVNMSSNADQEYFSDGLSEELLNVLAKITGLRVTSRTSSFSFKGTKTDIKTIAAKLNVQHILEGSVRKSGKIVRITAQLIDVQTDAHLWSDTYDVQLEDVLSVQDTISRAVAEALKITLLGKENVTQQRKINPNAYNAYLLANHVRRLLGKKNVEKAIVYYEQALSIDSNYALAWQGLSHAHSTQADYGYVPVDEGFRKARLEAEKALALDPNLAAAHSQMGWIKRSYDWDWVGADESYRRALELEPGNSSVISNAAVLAATLGRLDEAIRLNRLAIELNPLSTPRYNNLGYVCWNAGLLDQSEIAFKKVLELNPQHPGAHTNIGLVNLEKGKPDLALTEVMREAEPDLKTFGLAIVYHSLGKTKESDSALAELINKYQETDAFQIAQVYAYRGHADKAFEWLERAYERRDGGLSEMKGDALLRKLEKDPRYAVFMKKMRLPL